MSAIIHFYETCYGGFLGLHPPGPSYITVITFKNIWTEKDCAIRRLGKELFRAVIDAAETRGDVLNGAFAGAKEKEMQRMESRGRGSFALRTAAGGRVIEPDGAGPPARRVKGKPSPPSSASSPVGV